MAVDFLPPVIVHWPPTWALPMPLTGVHFTVPLPLAASKLLVYWLAYTVWMLTWAVPTFSISHWYTPLPRSVSFSTLGKWLTEVGTSDSTANTSAAAALTSSS